MCGAVDSVVVKYGTKEILIAGLEDGTVGVLDLTSTNGNSFKRPIFKMSNEREFNDTTHGQFQELAFEHEDSIVSIGTNMSSVVEEAETKPLVLSASKDGVLYVWRLHSSGDELL